MADIESGFGGQGEGRKKAGPNWQRILLPIIGLIVIAGGIAVAVLFSSNVATWAKRQFSIGGNLQKIGPFDPIQLAAGVVIFIIVMMVFATIYAVAAPKPPKAVNESQLDKEKKAKYAEDQRKKKAARQMKDRMRQRNKNG